MKNRNNQRTVAEISKSTQEHCQNPISAYAVSIAARRRTDSHRPACWKSCAEDKILRSLRLTIDAAPAHLSPMIFCAAHVNMKNRARFGAGDVCAR
jgi:hypothetical protein